MAQHISIKNSGIKELQKTYESICKSFRKGILSIKASLKFQEIVNDNFKNSENDKVFLTWKILKDERKTFEIHFDSEKNKITEIYLVK